jgi:hypothetical protein
MHQYFRDDKVSYTGTKFPELHNKLGVIHAPIVGNSQGYVVEIDGDDYVMGSHVLTPFQGHLKAADDGKNDGKDKKKSKRAGGPTVERRRGKGKEEEDAG